MRVRQKRACLNAMAQRCAPTARPALVPTRICQALRGHTQDLQAQALRETMVTLHQTLNTRTCDPTSMGFRALRTAHDMSK